MAKTASGRWPSQSFLRPLTYARSESLTTPLAHFTLASVFLFVVRRADDEAQASALDEGLEHLAREL